MFSLTSSWNVAAIAGVAGSEGFVFDDNGGIGIQATYAGTSAENSFTGASLEASVGPSFGFFWGADTIYELEGRSTAISLSIGLLFDIGIELVFLEGSSVPSGIIITPGLGVGADLHVAQYNTTKTTTIKQGDYSKNTKDSTTTSHHELNHNNQISCGTRYIDDVIDLLDDPNHKFIHINSFAVYQVY